MNVLLRVRSWAEHKVEKKEFRLENVKLEITLRSLTRKIDRLFDIDGW